jgi:ABC-type nitrate/sulfonate/bicarbonate transport system substrate-binding protein
MIAGGIDPDRDVRIAVVPAPAMFDNLKSGNLDGYCVGEPWNSVAVQAGIGWCVATSLQLAPFHPEKVLMVRRQFAEERGEDHLALVAALIEACAFCDRPENREHVIATIAYPKYVNVSVETLRASLVGRFDFGNGRQEVLPDFHIFSRRDANEPSTEKAAWVLRKLFSSGVIKNRAAAQIGPEVFRPDIFQQAKQLVLTSKKNEIEPHEERALVSAI